MKKTILTFNNFTEIVEYINRKRVEDQNFIYKEYLIRDRQFDLIIKEYPSNLAWIISSISVIADIHNVIEITPHFKFFQKVNLKELDKGKNTLVNIVKLFLEEEENENGLLKLHNLLLQIRKMNNQTFLLFSEEFQKIQLKRNEEIESKKVIRKIFI